MSIYLKDKIDAIQKLTTTSTIIFALFHITIRLILFPMVWYLLIYELFIIPQVIMLITLF